MRFSWLCSIVLVVVILAFSEHTVAGECQYADEHGSIDCLGALPPPPGADYGFSPGIPGYSSGGSAGSGGSGPSGPSIGGVIKIGATSISASTWLEFAFNLHAATWAAAENDVGHFRAYGGHQPHSQGSLINWNAAQVNWNLYGASDPSFTNRQVVENLVASLLGPSLP